ncbi:MAG: hypothetical protein JNN28_07865 [Saprospiraceae bacterium]|nr:hypothetical protein [Saprospiraceae bacterium]
MPEAILKIRVICVIRVPKNPRHLRHPRSKKIRVICVIRVPKKIRVTRVPRVPLRVHKKKLGANLAAAPNIKLPFLT